MSCVVPKEVPNLPDPGFSVVESLTMEVGRACQPATAKAPLSNNGCRHPKANKKRLRNHAAIPSFDNMFNNAFVQDNKTNLRILRQVSTLAMSGTDRSVG